MKRLEVRGRQWLGAFLVLVLVLGLASARALPFDARTASSSAHSHPSIWKIVLADRLTVGFLRLGVAAVVLFVLVSVPALVIAGRWLRVFGTGGLSADEAQNSDEAISVLNAHVKRLTQERDEALNARAEAEAAAADAQAALTREKQP